MDRGPHRDNPRFPLRALCDGGAGDRTPLTLLESAEVDEPMQPGEHECADVQLEYEVAGGDQRAEFGRRDEPDLDAGLDDGVARERAGLDEERMHAIRKSCRARRIGT